VFSILLHALQQSGQVGAPQAAAPGSQHAAVQFSSYILIMMLCALQQSGQVGAPQAAAPGSQHACADSLVSDHRKLTRVCSLSAALLCFMLCSKAAKSVRHKLPHQAVSTLPGNHLSKIQSGNRSPITCHKLL
jgi:hypothetical protein